MVSLVPMIAPIREKPLPPLESMLFDAVVCVWVEEEQGRISADAARWPCSERETMQDFSTMFGGESSRVCLVNTSDSFGRMLKQKDYVYGGTRLDAWVLARLVMPCGRAHSLIELLYELTQDDEIAPGARALVSAWPLLAKKMLGWPLPIVDAMQQFAGASGDAALSELLFRLSQVIRSQRGRSPVDIADCFRTKPLKFPRRDLVTHEESERLEPSVVAEDLGPAGLLSASVKGYELRGGQVEMARALSQAINEQKHLMVEAGTGVGKSLAYLLPSARWALANGMPVVVSTNTKNLQSQLCDKDLPLIKQQLLPDLNFALLKGRGNYVCLRRVAYVLRNREQELTEAECSGMVYALAWLIQTDTGDLGELRTDWLPQGALGVLWQIGSRAEECSGRSCKNFGRCFLQKARAKAWAANIIVANHSLVFAEMGSRSPVLPEHRQIIFDEAHNLESAATRHFSVEISEIRLRLTLRRLWRKRGRRQRGLLCSLRRQIESGSLSQDAEMSKRLFNACSGARVKVEMLAAHMGEFFEALGAWLPRPGAGTRRMMPEIKEHSRWQATVEAQQALLSRVGQLAQALSLFADLLREAGEEELGFHHESTAELAAAAQWMREFSADVDFVLAIDSAEHVFWIERAGATFASAQMWAAPLRVGGQLAEQLYAQKDSVVFCSATLSVGGSFKFMQDRLGIDRIPPDRLVTMQASSPFDYAEQCVVLVPSFLSDPASDVDRYTRDLAELMAEVFCMTEGRGLGLFTSYAMLRKCCDSLRPALATEGIRVLAQGEGVSREQLTDAFREEVNSVLMGTHSFWEGVDVVGESLSCVVVARLPFSAVGDPVFEARCEQVEREGKSAFAALALPSAVIRFRQGFGRLIRHRGDRGVVVVADSRVVTKRYGWAFRRSLPCRTVSMPDRAEFLDALRASVNM